MQTAETIPIDFDLDSLGGRQLADTLQTVTGLYALARRRGQETAGEFWGSLITVLIARALRERDQCGQSEALSYHLRVVDASH